jgi:hypothetical protein
MRVAKNGLLMAGSLIVLALFHAIHAVIPVECIRHDYWGIQTYKPKEVEFAERSVGCP